MSIRTLSSISSTHTCIQPQPHPGYAQQQSSTNVVVVQQSAAAVFPVVVRPDGYRPDAGQPALLFSMIITIFALVCGCWWSIVCSIPGMVFATSVSFNPYNIIIIGIIIVPSSKKTGAIV